MENLKEERKERKKDRIESRMTRRARNRRRSDEEEVCTINTGYFGRFAKLVWGGRSCAKEIHCCHYGWHDIDIARRDELVTQTLNLLALASAKN
jgi:hypothetical protein